MNDKRDPLQDLNSRQRRKLAAIEFNKAREVRLAAEAKQREEDEHKAAELAKELVDTATPAEGAE